MRAERRLTFSRLGAKSREALFTAMQTLAQEHGAEVSTHEVNIVTDLVVHAVNAGLTAQEEVLNQLDILIDATPLHRAALLAFFSRAAFAYEEGRLQAHRSIFEQLAKR